MVNRAALSRTSWKLDWATSGYYDMPTLLGSSGRQEDIGAQGTR